MHNKVKDKVCPVNTTAYIGCRGIAPLSLNPSLEGGGRVTSNSGRFAAEKKSRDQQNRRLNELQSRFHNAYRSSPDIISLSNILGWVGLGM